MSNPAAAQKVYQAFIDHMTKKGFHFDRHDDDLVISMIAQGEDVWQVSGSMQLNDCLIRLGLESLADHYEADTVGGWAAAEDWTVSDQVSAAVGKAQEQLMGVDYVPVALLGSQVVA